MDDLQSEIVEWHDREWGGPEKKGVHYIALKLTEEAGEVAGAAVKWSEGRRSIDDIRDELGDVLIVCHVLADRLRTTVPEVLSDRWAEVQDRRGTANG